MLKKQVLWSVELSIIIYRIREKTSRHKNGVEKVIYQNILINICKNGESSP